MSNTPTLTSVKALWVYLTGNPNEFALESRIFNSLCLAGLVAIAYHIPFNFIVGLQVSGYIAVTLFVLQSAFYYLARFKKKLHQSIFLSGVTIHALFIINYYFNGGINGPTLILLVLTFFLLITVASKRSNAIWVVVNLSIVLLLLVSEYNFPELVTNNVNEGNLFIDIGSAYIVTVVLIYLGMSYIRKSYYKEKKSAETRTKSVEKSNDEKDKLFSIISHDLKAPLATIHDYLQILSEEDFDPAEKQEFENELLQITRNTQDLLTNILTWSTSQMEGLKVHIQEVNVLKTLHPTLMVQRSIAAKKDIVVEFIIDRSLNILADPDMLQVIVRNLINNSIKFTKPGGRVYVDCVIQQAHCLITVRDTGIGMTESKIRDLFSLKARSTYGTQNEKGVGLGLLLCKEFTEAQNGKIWLESQEGKGTAFYILLPVDEKAYRHAKQAELFSAEQLL